MVTNGGFLVTKIKQLGDRIFEKVLAEKNIDAFNGPQGRILYVLWQQDGVPIKAVSDACGLAITSLTTMLERMENQGLIRREADAKDRRKTLLYLTDRARALKEEYDAVSEEMGSLYYRDFTEEEIRQFEGYLARIQHNLEEKLKA
ncbi:MAG: radical SAM mobile pair system MarR family transcriptional regulator [Clostridia bacterium]|nr:radical SAM mobile pair system MarR family transcriptional regulator [Clostridia bacterium]